jgi:ABC-type glycerol-3-phosphate transport system substrate-binding protein
MSSKARSRLFYTFTPAAYLLGFTILLLIAQAGCSALQPATPTPEPIILKFAFQGSGTPYEVLAAQFQKLNPGVTVELNPLTDQYRGVQDLENMGADVIRWDASLMSTDFLPSLLKLDNVMIISKFSKDDMIAGTLEALQTEGVQYGIPAGINPVVMYASPKRFADAGVQLPAGVWTLDDMLTAATKVNAQQSQLSDPGYAAGICTQPQGFDPIIFTYLFGGNIFDRMPNPTQITLNRPENVQAVQWYADLFTKYNIAPKLDSLQGTNVRVDAAALIEVNKCGFWTGFFADLFTNDWGANNENRPVMLSLPIQKAPLNMVYMDGYFISSQTHNAKLAWEWIAFLLERPESASGMIPPRISQVKSEAFQTSIGKDAAAVANSLPARVVVFSQRMGDYRLLRPAFENYTNAIQAIIAGQADAQSALDWAQQQVDAGGTGN